MLLGRQGDTGTENKSHRREEKVVVKNTVQNLAKVDKMDVEGGEIANGTYVESNGGKTVHSTELLTQVPLQEDTPLHIDHPPHQTDLVDIFTKGGTNDDTCRNFTSVKVKKECVERAIDNQFEGRNEDSESYSAKSISDDSEGIIGMYSNHDSERE